MFQTLTKGYRQHDMETRIRLDALEKQNKTATRCNLISLAALVTIAGCLVKITIFGV